MPRDIKELLAEVEKHGFAIGSPIPVDGATSELFGNLQPVPSDQSLLHYMPVRRFESLVANKALYLRRLDLFEDQFEGKLPTANDSKISDFTEKFSREFGMAEKNIEAWKHFNTVTLRKHTFVHCWFASENEDSTMWRDYADAGRGVCIRTTAGQLAKSLARPDHLGLDLRRVTYTDETEALPEIMACLPAGRKQARHEYVREKEVRLIATITEKAWERGFDTPDREPPKHQLIPIDASVLLETVFLGQQMSADVAERIARLANEAAGRQIARRSNMPPETKVQT